MSVTHGVCPEKRPASTPPPLNAVSIGNAAAASTAVVGAQMARGGTARRAAAMS